MLSNADGGMHASSLHRSVSWTEIGWTIFLCSMLFLIGRAAHIGISCMNSRAVQEFASTLAGTLVRAAPVWGVSRARMHPNGWTYPFDNPSVSGESIEMPSGRVIPFLESARRYAEPGVTLAACAAHLFGVCAVLAWMTRRAAQGTAAKKNYWRRSFLIAFLAMLPASIGWGAVYPLRFFWGAVVEHAGGRAWVDMSAIARSGPWIGALTVHALAVVIGSCLIQEQSPSDGTTCARCGYPVAELSRCPECGIDARNRGLLRRRWPNPVIIGMGLVALAGYTLPLIVGSARAALILLRG